MLGFSEAFKSCRLDQLQAFLGHPLLIALILQHPMRYLVLIRHLLQLLTKPLIFKGILANKLFVDLDLVGQAV